MKQHAAFFQMLGCAILGMATMVRAERVESAAFTSGGGSAGGMIFSVGQPAVGATLSKDHGAQLGLLACLGFDVTPMVLGDLDGNGAVDGIDLGVLLSQWDASGSADLNGDGVVNGVDLGILLSNWG